jgi:hypothetical protein
MLENLEFGRSAYFFRYRKKLSKAAIDRLFRQLRSAAQQPSQNLFCVVRQQHGSSRYSAVCFSYEREPAFLSRSAGAVERIFGFLMLVESGQFVTLFRSGLDLPSAFKTEYFDKIGNERVEAAIASSDATFEKLRLKNMSISSLTLRSKSLEALNLENAVARSSASRFTPQGYRVRRPDGSYSATPSTGRISVRSDRAGYEALVEWANEISHQLESGAGEVSAFIQNFARPLDLASIPRRVSPTYVGIDILGLADAVFGDQSAIRLVTSVGDRPVELGSDRIHQLFADLEAPLPVVKRRKHLEVQSFDGEAPVGTLKINKTRIGLKFTNYTATEKINVESIDAPIGQDPESVSLARYIDRQNLFTVIFSDVALAYIDGSLFRDEALLGGGGQFLSYLMPSPELAKVTSEKGAFNNGQAQFDDNSVFRKLIDNIAEEDVLVCDDLGDEWADFIGVSHNSQPKKISFYHAKFGPRSLSASAFHDAVGQAIKNLGQMDIPAAAIERKLRKWSRSYRNEQTETAIARIVRGGDRRAIESSIENVRSAPDVYRRAVIVTSSLSKGEVETALNSAAQGIPPKPHFVQLYWLLMSYFSACAEMSVQGYVVCRP